MFIILFILGSLIDFNYAFAKNDNPNTLAVEIGRADIKRYRVSIPEFISKNPLVANKLNEMNKLNKRLSELLGFYDIIDILPVSSFVASKQAPLQPIIYSEWSSILSDFVVFGIYDFPPNSDFYTIDLRLFDIKNKKIAIGKRYSNVSISSSDKFLKRFGDLCVEYIIGQLGVFSSKIAFVASPQPGNVRHVYISDFDGSNPEKISNYNSIHSHPSWSSDGSKLLFTSFKTGKAEIYIYNLKTKKTLQLTHSVGSSYGGNWHPFAPLIAFSNSKHGQTQIEQIELSKKFQRSTLISESRLDVEPVYSPDGKYIAYTTMRFGKPHIVVRNIENRSEWRLTHQGWYNSSPSWRPDGKKIIFTGLDKEEGTFDIFVTSFNQNQKNVVNPLERLTLGVGDNQYPSWSPDGQHIIFQSNRNSGKNGTKQTKLYVMNKEGSNQRELNIPLFNLGMPSWGPRISDL